MKYLLISDNIDTQMGMRLAGIEGVVVHEREEILEELQKAVDDKEVGVVLMTQKLISACHDEVYEIKLKWTRPLIVEIPDRHGTSEVSKAISSYVNQAIGIKI